MSQSAKVPGWLVSGAMVAIIGAIVLVVWVGTRPLQPIVYATLTPWPTETPTISPATQTPDIVFRTQIDQVHPPICITPIAGAVCITSEPFCESVLATPGITCRWYYEHGSMVRGI